MVPNVSVKTYRPRQQMSFREERRPNTRFSFSMSGKAQKYSAIMVAAALVAGLTITQFFHGQMTVPRTQLSGMRMSACWPFAPSWHQKHILRPLSGQN
jgi:hypothetical protein